MKFSILNMSAKLIHVYDKTVKVLSRVSLIGNNHIITSSLFLTNVFIKYTFSFLFETFIAFTSYFLIIPGCIFFNSTEPFPAFNHINFHQYLSLICHLPVVSNFFHISCSDALANLLSFLKIL